MVNLTKTAKSKSMGVSKWLLISVVSILEAVHCQPTEHDLTRCSYTFLVSGQGQCEKHSDIDYERLQAQVGLLQRQVTSLGEQLTSVIRQNDQLVQKITTAEPLDGQSHYSMESKTAETGSVYIRWGRTECPANATEVYAGYAAGSHYQNSGGMAEYLCLPKNPQWNEFVEGLQSEAYIYGAEYQTKEHYRADLFDLSNNNGESLHQNDVPCVVCYASGRGSVFMFPALNSCPANWHLEYQGYLMAPRPGFKSYKKPVCMDETPEVVVGGQANQNGALFYMVEARCGSLPCPNYVEGRELTCAVCTH